METVQIANCAEKQNSNQKAPAVDPSAACANWRKCLFTLTARKGKRLTLTYLSLRGSSSADQQRVQEPVAAKIHLRAFDGAGDCALYVPQAKTIILRRSDFLRLHDYTLHHGPLRDFCLFRVPMKCGLRPGEIRCLRWENVDFAHQILQVQDSKKHILLPVPMDLATADYLCKLKGDKTDGWVIGRDPKGRAWQQLKTPLHLEQLHHILRKWARLAGCETWQKMRLYDLRHYFAVNWMYPSDGKKPGNLHVLSRILRHDSLLSTQVYLSRLVFFEDLQAEYNRLQGWPFTQAAADVPTVGNEFFDRYCRICDRQPTCRFMDQAMSSAWASGCRFFQQHQEIEKQKEGSRNDCSD